MHTNIYTHLIYAHALYRATIFFDRTSVIGTGHVNFENYISNADTWMWPSYRNQIGRGRVSSKWRMTRISHGA